MNNTISLPAQSKHDDTTPLSPQDAPIPYALVTPKTLGHNESRDETCDAVDAEYSAPSLSTPPRELLPSALAAEPASLLKQLDPELWPREKMGREGAGALTNQELLAVLFGRGQRGKDVLTLAGEVILYLERVPETPSLPELMRIHGIGHGKACQILATLELSRRFLTRNHRARIRKAADALPYLASLRGRRQECFVVITLDGNHQIIRAHEITVGLANQSQVHPRETFACALEDRAVGIMAAHNHPSGSLDPSSDDLAITRRLAESGRMLGIPLLDHLIVTTQGYTSLRERFPDVFGGRG